METGDVRISRRERSTRTFVSVLTRHGFDAANQIVLGKATLHQLHKNVGEGFTSEGSSKLLRIVHPSSWAFKMIGT